MYYYYIILKLFILSTVAFYYNKEKANVLIFVIEGFRYIYGILGFSKNFSIYIRIFCMCYGYYLNFFKSILLLFSEKCKKRIVFIL